MGERRDFIKSGFGERDGADGRETLKHVFGEREDEERL